MNSLISLVIPVYNTEKYIKRCLDSVLEQTYKNIEIIIVDDYSPGDIKEIVLEYMEKHANIYMVSHKQNKGLFRARLTGATKAKGEYIAFLDSDDYITVDFYRALLDKIIKDSADIAIANTIFQKADGEKLIYNLHDSMLDFDSLSGEEIKQAFFSQRGQCFSWHTVWNKLYRKSLWDKCASYYEKLEGHIIMTEDIAFSTPLLYFAKKITKTPNEGCYYCENADASTNVDKISVNKYVKNFSDMKKVFDFVEFFLQQVGAKQKYKDDFLEFRKLYSRMWRTLGEVEFFGAEKTKAIESANDFLPNYKEYSNQDDNFFASIQTPWNSGVENIKKQILESEQEYISFDIFDTLVYRPLYNPTDVFYLMDKKFEEVYNPGSTSFHEIRIQAEHEARKQLWINSPGFQDVNIYEIYNTMAEKFYIPEPVANEMLQEEQRQEIELCSIRKTAKEIYDLAADIGKKIIVVSDMYLDRETIEEILFKNGFNRHEALFISSEERLTKNTGELFKGVIKKLGTKGKNIIHIGDTWNSDIVNSEAFGITPIFFPKAKDVFNNEIASAETGNCSAWAAGVSDTILDMEKVKKSLGLRTMLALIANKYFDNPYRTFNSESGFNGDPRFLGYYALGMHLFALISWITQNAEIKKKAIVFLARDGYLPFLGINIYEKYFDNCPKSSYINVSRQSMLPAIIENKEDFFDLPLTWRNHSVKTVLNLVGFCIKDDVKDDLAFKIKENGFLLEKTFSTENEYFEFLRFFIGELYDEDKHKSSRIVAKDYLEASNLKESLVFDMGYSARIQAGMVNLVGKELDVCFLHSDPLRSFQNARRKEMNITTFYDFYPKMTGLIREHIFSETGGTCTGYAYNANKAEPVFAQEERLAQDKFILDAMQLGAVGFVDDFLNIYHAYLEYLPFKNQEISLPFESYLYHGSDIDTKLFRASYFEDMVYGAVEDLNVYDFLKEEKTRLISSQANHFDMSDFNTSKSMLLEAAIIDKNAFTKAIVYLFCDRSIFKEKLKIKLKKHPRLYNFARKLHGIFKK